MSNILQSLIFIDVKDRSVKQKLSLCVVFNSAALVVMIIVYGMQILLAMVDCMQELIQKKLMKSVVHNKKSAAMCALISRMAPVLIDASAVSALFTIALSTKELDHRACVVELLAVCYSAHLVTCIKIDSSTSRWQ